MLSGILFQISFSYAYTCGEKKYCSEMNSCEEAYFYYKHCGLTYLDGDGDGIPCENLCFPWNLPKEETEPAIEEKPETIANAKSDNEVKTEKPSLSFGDTISLIAFFLKLIGFPFLLGIFLFWLRRRKRYSKKSDLKPYTSPLKPVIPREKETIKRDKSLLWKSLKAIDANETYILKGDTFNLKEEIKALGGKWNPNLKGWLLQGDKVKQLISQNLDKVLSLEVNNDSKVVKIKLVK